MKREFVLPERMSLQLYKQFGNAVVIPQVGWLADHIVAKARHVFAERVLTDGVAGGLL